MKHVLVLLFVALLALGTFSLMDFSGGATGLAGPMKHLYPTSIMVPSQQSQYVIPAQGKVYVFNTATLTANNCILAREIMRMNNAQGLPINDDLNDLLMVCISRGW